MGGPGREIGPADEAWAEAHPALLEYLSVETWADGRARTTSTVLIFYDTGACKACLNDRDNGRVAFVSAGSPETVLAALERGLEDDTLDWRAARKTKMR